MTGPINSFAEYFLFLDEYWKIFSPPPRPVLKPYDNVKL